MIFSEHPSPKKLSDHSNTPLANFFLEELKGIFGIEKDLIETLGHFLKKEYSKEFSQVISTYASSSNKNLERLEQIFLLTDTPISSSHGPVLMGLLQESKNITEEDNVPPIITDLKIYKIISQFHFYKLSYYSQLVTVSDKMQLKEVSEILRQNLVEENQMAEKIKHIESHIVI
jgi:ferritin-like metal-binding protein YciE